MSFATAASQKSVWGFSPQSIPGLQLWLDGADRSSMVFSGTSTTITRWNDKSGNGLHGTATGTPTYTANALNGLGAPALNSNANYFSTPTFIISPTAGTPSIFMIMNQTAYSGSGNSDFFLASDWQRIDFIGQGGAFNAAVTMNGGAQTPINVTTTSNNPTLLSLVVNTASGGVGYANGTFTATSGSSGGRLLSTDTYLIGGGPGFIGFIYELIVFNNTVSTPQRQQVEGYLAAKWGLKANLPATHPYSAGSIIPFNRPFYPTDIGGCQLWLDAADTSTVTGTSSVSAWADKSGTGNNMSLTAAGVSYASNKVTFASGGIMTSALSTTITNGQSVVFIVCEPTSVPTNGISMIFACSDIQPGDYPGDYSIRLDGITTLLYSINIGDIGFNNSGYYINGNLGQVINGRITIPSGPNVIYGLFNRSGTTRFSLSSPFGTNRYFIGNIQEVVVFTGPITTPQRQQVEQYLTWKWGLPVANLPTGHPGKLLPAFGTPFTPKSVTGLQLWLDAMDQSTMTFSSGTSNVATWNDKSGSGFNMTGFVGVGGSTIPSYSATTALSPPGVVLCSRGTTNHNFFASSVWNSSLTVPTATHCLIAVHNPASTTVSPGNSSLFRFQGTGSTAVTSIVFPQYLNNIPGNGRGVYTNNQGTGTINYYNSSLFENSSAGVLNLITANIAATSQFIYKNGTQQSSYTSTINNVTSDNFVIGCQNWTNINGQQYDFYSGTIHEMFVFNTTLTTPQRQQVEGYLAWKWGLQSSLPSTHAYAKFAP